MNQVIRKPSTNNLMYSNNNGEQFAATFVGTQWLWDKQIYNDKSYSFDEEIGSYIRDEYDLLIDGMTAEGISMSTARSNAVEDNWAIYHFFSRDDIGAPQEIFTHANDKGEVVPFSDEQISQIENWEQGDGGAIDGIEGHHIQPVNYYPDNIELAANPNNIVFATETAHLDHLHDGNYSNYTADQYLSNDNIYTHEEMLDMTIGYRQDLYMSQSPLYEDAGLLTYMGVGAIAAVTIFTTVKAAFEMYQLRDSTFSNHHKRKIILHQSISNVMVGSIIATTAVGAKVGYDAIFHDISVELIGAEILLSSFDVVVGFGVAQVASGLIRYQAERKKGLDDETAKRNLQQIISLSMIEMAVFTGVGLGAIGLSEILQSVGEDAVTSAFDPTGITATTLITYKGIKFGKSYFNKRQNKNAFVQCREIRAKYMFDLAKNENYLSPVY